MLLKLWCDDILIYVIVYNWHLGKFVKLTVSSVMRVR
jgi:hypothetical protein